MENSRARIFLLSHMRAYSSLLGHILGSHAQINGYYEMHISYLNKHSLQEQENLYLQHESYKPGSHYLFDKILHNDYELALTQLGLIQPKILLTLRSPEQTIKSIINLFRKKDRIATYSFPAKATEYYIQRLQKLSMFCQNNPSTCYYFDAELLLCEPEQLLGTLTGWLELNTPLQSQYQRFAKTGQAGAGDSSNDIHSGQIMKNRNNYSDIKLSGELLQAAQLAYKKTRDQLIQLSIANATITDT